MEQVKEILSRSRDTDQKGLPPMNSTPPKNLQEPGQAPDICPACNGLGVVREDVPVGHPKFGKLDLCPLCGTDRRDQWLRSISRLSPEMLSWNLAGFRDRGKLEGVLKELYRLLREGYGWATLSGPPGTGKTYLLAAMTNEARLMGKASTYITTAELLQELRDSFHPDGPGFSALFSTVMNAAFLALDEIEKFYATAWAEEQFYKLIEYRYRHWDQGITVLATNRRIGLAAPVLADTRYPGYVESRIMDGRFAHLDQFWQVKDARPALRVIEGEA